MAKLAHVAGVASRSEPDVVRRIVAEIDGIVDHRETYFRRARHRLDRDLPSARCARRRQRPTTGTATCSSSSTAGARSAASSTPRAALQDLAGRGLTFGLHLVVTAARWMDFRSPDQGRPRHPCELRLGDHTDSEIDRRSRRTSRRIVPVAGCPMSRHHFLAGVPRIDGDRRRRAPRSRRRRPDRARQRRVEGPEPAQAAPAARARSRSTTVRQQAGGDDRRVLLGVDEATSRPIGQDIIEDPHLYLFGDSDSGKSALLRGYAAGGHAAGTPRSRRRSSPSTTVVRCSVRSPPTTSRATSPPTTRRPRNSADLAQYLRARLPGPDVTAEQLRNRRGGAAPRCTCSSTTTTSSPPRWATRCRPLQPLLAQAGDVGLHLVLTRRSGGASRALFDPVIQALRDLAAPGHPAVRQPGRGAAHRQRQADRLGARSRSPRLARSSVPRWSSLAFSPSRHG